MFQCPKTMRNLSNELHPIRIRKPKSASALETGYAVLDAMGSCWFLPDKNKVLVQYGNFMIWLCHSVPKLFWNGTKFGNIGPIILLVLWRVFRALTKVGYWDRIRGSKFQRLPNVYDLCAVTAARTLVIFHITIDKYFGLINEWKKCLNFTFSHFFPVDLSWHRKFQRLLIV